MDDLAAIAVSQLGVSEDAAHTNCGAAILKYQQATNLDGQGWPWCAAFVDWCVAQRLAHIPDPALNRPRTASAFGLIAWARRNNCAVLSARARAVRNDIVVYTFSHCGIVESGDAFGFVAIEGNTNADGGRDGYTVARRLRRYPAVEAFIRLPA